MDVTHCFNMKKKKSVLQITQLNEKLSNIRKKNYIVQAKEVVYDLGKSKLKVESTSGKVTEEEISSRDWR